MASDVPSVIRLNRSPRSEEVDDRSSQDGLSIYSAPLVQDASGKPVKSAKLTLISLLSKPSNRSCADCRVALVDHSQIHASFFPKRDFKVPNSDVSVSLHDFLHNHEKLAPPIGKVGKDPANLVNQKLGGHGVFICPQCAVAHKLLGESITVVHPVQDTSAWTTDKAEAMKESGGNLQSWSTYEAYIPETWKQHRPNPGSSTQERLFFCRAKYEALAFALPPPGPLAVSAWNSILDRNDFLKRFASNELRNLQQLTPLKSPTANSNEKMTRHELPDRLIDFFCVVTCSMQLDPTELNRDLSKVSFPEDISFWPTVSDCYPTQNGYQDMDFPAHLASFVLPDGCRANERQETPAFYTFVLTEGDGDRIYGGILRIYDEHTDVEKFREAIVASGYPGKLPRFLTDQRTEDDADVVFFPKCLVLISHHAFFDLFRSVLLQLYRITLVEAPLPIERYIANIASEVPLPPPGRIKVECGFTTDQIWTIERPPVNKLPLANFSFRPLFASLSIGNILVLLGCIMKESKIVILSQHYSLLCPVAEALLSFVFPFTWQGLYIPVMPYSMLDILDAPVPFIVGLHSRYLQNTDPKNRPQGLIFVDLDRDVLHLGFDDETGKPRFTPALPRKAALKLKASLEKFADSVYIMPDTGIKGCIMTGHGTLIENEERRSYSRMTYIHVSSESLGRTAVFSMTDKAYDDNDLSTTSVGFAATQGKISMADEDSVHSFASRSVGKRKPTKMPTFLKKGRKSSSMEDNYKARRQAHLLDMTEPEGFSSEEIRNAFLRFFVSVFKDYQSCLLSESGTDLFDESEFVEEMNASDSCLDFLQQVLGTQMFQRFLEERSDCPDLPEMRFFDESITAKNNRSKAVTLKNGGKKKPTPFLDDESGKVIQTFTPPAPSNLGLPDDGSSYHYGTFPSLNHSLFGSVRPPIIWPELHRESSRQRISSSLRVRATQFEIIQKATIEPLWSSKNPFYALARRTAVDLESALKAMSALGTSSTRSANAVTKYESPRVKTDPSERGSVGTMETPTKVNTLSKFETFILNARRKQGILLELIALLQACCRMFLQRKNYKRFRRAIVQLQRRFLRSSDLRGQAKGLQYQVRQAVRIQSAVRSHLARLHMRQELDALKFIQRWFRGEAFRKDLRVKRKTAALLQAAVRRRRTTYHFHLLRSLVCMVQAKVRGCQVRSRMRKLREGRMSLYRRQLLRLWGYSHTPLSFRTKFWPSVATEDSFLRLKVAEREVLRLLKLLGVAECDEHNLTKINGSEAEGNDETFRLGEKIGIDNTAYCCVLRIEHMQKEEILFEPYPLVVKNGHEFEEAERLQIYERLDALKQDLEGVYKEFEIPLNSKKRKARLAKDIWTSPEHANYSASVMMLLFPELESSLNISFVTPRAKSKRRVPHTRKVGGPPIDRSLWDSVSLEARIKLHLAEVVPILMTKVPSIMAKLDRLDKRKDTRYKSQQTASMISSGQSNWNKCRRAIITGYLAGRQSFRQPNAKSAETAPQPSVDGCVAVEDVSSPTNTIVLKFHAPVANDNIASAGSSKKPTGVNFPSLGSPGKGTNAKANSSAENSNFPGGLTRNSEMPTQMNNDSSWVPFESPRNVNADEPLNGNVSSSSPRNPFESPTNASADEYKKAIASSKSQLNPFDSPTNTDQDNTGRDKSKNSDFVADIDSAPNPFDEYIETSPNPFDEDIKSSPNPFDEYIETSPNPFDEDNKSSNPFDVNIESSPKPFDEE